MIIRHTNISNTGDFSAAASLIRSIMSRNTTGSAVSDTDLLFFDIETTGLSADSSFLYLIGCMYLNADGLVISQFFSEGIREETLLISEFDRLLAAHPVLVHFNGSTFDIPYICKKRKKLGISEPDFEYESFDIYKLLHPYKAFLGAGSMSQKKLETYCGLNRHDIYDGGELIGFYNRYIAMKRLEMLQKRSSGDYIPSGRTGLTTAGTETSSELLECLMLHNYEDVLNMSVVSRLLALPDFLDGGYSIDSYELLNDSLYFTLTPASPLLSYSFGKCHSCRCNPANEISIVPNDGRYVLSIPVICEELKFFYPDHKNYYYLPGEDSAIHKSIGEFMDKSLRTSCKAEKCYTRHLMSFIPLAGELGKKDSFPFKLFKRYYSDRFAYVSTDEILSSPDMTREYVRRIISNLI